MDFILTDRGRLRLFETPFATADHCWILLDTSATPSVTTWVDYDDISAFEVNGVTYPDYAANAPLDATGESVATVGGFTVLDIADANFGASVTISGRYLVLMDSTAVALTGTTLIIGYADITGGGNASSVSNNFAVNINALGLHRFGPVGSF